MLRLFERLWRGGAGDYEVDRSAWNNLDIKPYQAMNVLAGIWAAKLSTVFGVLFFL